MSVTLSKNAALWAIIALAAFGWLLLAAVQPNGGLDSLIGNLTAGLILGTIFGQASLAAAWCALGPFALVRRLPLSFAWLAAIVISFGCHIASSGNSDGLAVLLVYGGAVLVQWLLVQAPIWLFVFHYGLRVVYRDEVPSQNDRRDQQFGIRQVMILTTIVAVVLGASRALLGELKTNDSSKNWSSIGIFAFLAFSNAVISFPLIAATLLGRKMLRAVCVALLLVVFATAVELPLIALLIPSSSGRNEIHLMFSLINAFQCAWILAVLLLLRLGGFRLMSRRYSADAINPA